MALGEREAVVECGPEATQAATFDCFVPPWSSDSGRRQRLTSLGPAA